MLLSTSPVLIKKQANIASGGPLPISLSEFYGIKQHGINKISWKAETGINFSHYNIERSADGNNFDPIAVINSTGSILYNYSDSNIDLLKPYYYRLKLVEKGWRFYLF